MNKIFFSLLLLLFASCTRYIITGTNTATGEIITVHTKQIDPAWCDTLITTEGIIITNYKITEK